MTNSRFSEEPIIEILKQKCMIALFMDTLPRFPAEPLEGRDSLLQQKLWLSDRFASTFNADGSSTFFNFSNPTEWIRVQEKEREFILVFSTTSAIQVSTAIAVFSRRLGFSLSPDQLNVLLRLTERLCTLTVLITSPANPPLYSQGMTKPYLKARGIPQEICSDIIKQGAIDSESRVLDIATGIGDLALSIARTSNYVRGIDISAPFLAVAIDRATKAGNPAHFSQQCANRLLFEDQRYQIITIAQAFHWLNISWASHGIYQSLDIGGSFFALESKSILHEQNPIRKLLGYGCGDNNDTIRKCISHAKRYMTIFELFRPSGSFLALAGLKLFRQQRQFDIDFARAYFFQDAIASYMPTTKRPWDKLQALLDDCSEESLAGTMYWMLVRFEHMKADRKAPVITFDADEIIDLPE